MIYTDPEWVRAWTQGVLDHYGHTLTDGVRASLENVIDCIDEEKNI